MNEAQFCVNWSSYLNHVSKGFASLQQNAEFVDMTLAAEGHLVKVHQNIVALASPYLKAMLQSASCRHPVIFLNNVNHKTLGYILEYIYTGEVKIPSNEMKLFIAACKSLCINGINTADSKNMLAKQPDPPIERIDKPLDNFAAHITINTNNNDYNLEMVSNNNDVNINNNEVNINNNELILPPPVTVIGDMELKTESIQKVDDNTVCENSIDSDSISNFVIMKPHYSSTTTKLKNPIKIISDVTINPISDVNVNPNSDPSTSLIDWETQLSSSQIKNANKKLSKENQVNINYNTNLTENPVNISLDTDHWFLKNNQNTSNMDLSTDIPINTLAQDYLTIPMQNNLNMELNSNTPLSTLPQNCLTIPIQISSNMELNTNPINITLSTEDWQCEPSQSTSQIEFNANPIEEPLNLPLSTVDMPTNSCDTTDITLDKKDVHKNLKKIGSFMKLTKNQEKNLLKLTKTKGGKITLDNVPHYTISNRGALQIIMNHYLYHSHHYSSGGRKRRWRCINYRKIHCPAFIDTNDEEITAMSTDHDHPNHDNQIRKKIKSNLVFTSLTNAIGTIRNLLNDKNVNVDIDKLDL